MKSFKEFLAEKEEQFEESTKMFGKNLEITSGNKEMLIGKTADGRVAVMIDSSKPFYIDVADIKAFKDYVKTL